MIITNELLYKKITDVEKLLLSFQKEHLGDDIREISLNKACKLLGLGQTSVLNYVNRGQLQARVYTDSKKKLRYRFRLADIRSFQIAERRAIPVGGGIKSAKEIAEDIFHQNN